ncbi:hypothetical protein FRC11_006963 [Ceratobasidium sp. 423]|nr:hypothetical protein FRC11_006963 [Ceratobasidium sp. 423]
MDELLAASGLLRSALDRYIKACSTATKSYDPSSGKEAKQRTFMDRIMDELRVVATYEIDLRIARSTLTQCRNSAPVIAPVNTLPSELLAQIFTLLCVSTRNCLTHNEGDMFNQGHPEGIRSYSPHTLSHVCSRWRQIALGSCILWSHIDIIASDQWCTKLLPRAELLGNRAKIMPLSLHFSNPYQNSAINSKEISQQVSTVCSSLGPKAQSFRLDSLAPPEGNEFSHLLNLFLRHARPHGLSELRLLDHGGSAEAGVLCPNNLSESHHHELETWERFETLCLTVREVDELLRPVRVLWLRNVFFLWTCHAYTGLTDLRLIDDRGHRYDVFHIYMYQLEGILSSCPRLHTLYFNLWINLSGIRPTVQLVSLRELEVVNLQLMCEAQVSWLLSRISPGKKSLELSIPVSDNTLWPPGNFLPQRVLDFFRRSCITRLFLHKARDYGRHARSLIEVPLAKLLSELPTGLCTLGLNRFEIRQKTEKPTSWPHQLDTLYMRGCSCEIATLRKLTRICPIQTIKFDGLPFGTQLDTQKQLEEEAAKLAPKVNSRWQAPAPWMEG